MQNVQFVFYLVSLFFFSVVPSTYVSFLRVINLCSQ